MLMRLIRAVIITVITTAMCVGCTTGQSEEQSPAADIEDTPVFIDVETAASELRAAYWGSHGWTIQLPEYSDCLFAEFGYHLLRYNIAENTIESAVKWTDHQGLAAMWRFSPDGNYAISYKVNHSDGSQVSKTFLIDFLNKEISYISNTLDSINADEMLPSAFQDGLNLKTWTGNNTRELDNYTLVYEWREDGLGYGLYAYDEMMQKREIALIRDSLLANDLPYVIVDGELICSMIPMDHDSRAYLGYYKFVLIDVESGSMIQEYPINTGPVEMELFLFLENEGEQPSNSDLIYDSLLTINVPAQIGNPETSFQDFFASLGVTEWSLMSYDENVTRGDDKGAFVTYDLGSAGLFTVCVFQNMNGSWDVEYWRFLNPNTPILQSLIEKAIADILAYEHTDESEWNKETFRSNTIDSVMYGDTTLEYVYYCFENDNGQGGRGMILAELGSRILGSRDNVPKGWATGEEWFSKLYPLEIVTLPPFNIDALGFSKFEALAAKALIDEKNRYYHDALIVTHIHHAKEDGDALTLWVTGLFSCYTLYEKKLVMTSGGEIRACIEFKKDPANQYIVTNITQAMDGSDYPLSIKAFCEPIPGLYEEMMDFNFYDELQPKIIDALRKHMNAAGLIGIYLYDESWDRRTLLS